MTWQNRIVGYGEEPPENFIANPDNWRTHPRHQRQALRGLLEEVGCVQNVIVNTTTGHMIDGHLRVELALEDGQPSVPVTFVTLTEAEEAKVLATLDPLGGLAGTDQTVLNQLLDDIESSNEALLDLLASLRVEPEEEKPGKDEDAAPEIVEEYAVTLEGETWILGEHRLTCGDCLDPSVIEQALGGKVADMVWTDPPYNVDYEGTGGKKIANDKMGTGAFRDFLTSALGAAREHTKQGGAVYIAHADSEGLNFRAAALEAGWSLRQCLIWVKNSFTLGRQDYQWQHEPVLYGWNPGAAHHWYGEFDKATVLDLAPSDIAKLKKEELIGLLTAIVETSTVIREDKPRRNREHPTMKPVNLVARMMKNSSRPRDLVLDPFAGSGTTLIAAHKLGRRAALVELDPRYCDVIVRRYQEFTTRQAVNQDGDYFDAREPRKLTP